MKSYLIKLEKDQNGNVTVYKVLYRTSAKSKPRGGDYLVLSCDDSVIAPKIEIIDDSPALVEDVTAAALVSEEKEVQKELAEMELGKRVIATISMRNKKKSLTIAQVQQITQTYSGINALLLNGSLGSAKAAIEAEVPDGTLVTQEDKGALLALLSEY